MITDKIAKKIVDRGITTVRVRSILGCRAKHGVCSKCYGMGLATREEVNPRVEELFEARNPKGLAIISEIDGVVSINNEKKRKEVIVTGKDDAKTYVISFGSKLRVKDGDEIHAADQITEGSINPNDLLTIKGPEGVYNYIISEVQKVYRNQGVDINDKHIEVIARQMLKKVRIEDSGDTGLFTASLVDMYDFEEANEKAIQLLHSKKLQRF